MSRPLPRGCPGPHLGGVQAQAGGVPACTEADTPQQTATAVDGMHPTGMHSCLDIFLQAEDPPMKALSLSDIYRVSKLW